MNLLRQIDLEGPFWDNPYGVLFGGSPWFCTSHGLISLMVFVVTKGPTSWPLFARIAVKFAPEKIHRSKRCQLRKLRQQDWSETKMWGKSHCTAWLRRIPRLVCMWIPFKRDSMTIPYFYTTRTTRFFSLLSCANHGASPLYGSRTNRSHVAFCKGRFVVRMGESKKVFLSKSSSPPKKTWCIFDLKQLSCTRFHDIHPGERAGTPEKMDESGDFRWNH